MNERMLRTVGIVGAAAKGAAIAVSAMLAGYRVILEDVSPFRLTEATASVSAALRAAVARGEIEPVAAQEIERNFSTTQSIDALARSADLLIEAAPEDAELQLEIFTIFDKFAKPNAILASTARSVSIADLAEMTNCPERCVGLRFPRSPANEELLQIYGAEKTSDRTLNICSSFARRIGVLPRIVRECQGAATALPGEHGQ